MSLAWVMISEILKSLILFLFFFSFFLFISALLRLFWTLYSLQLFCTLITWQRCDAYAQQHFFFSFDSTQRTPAVTSLTCSDQNISTNGVAVYCAAIVCATDCTLSVCHWFMMSPSEACEGNKRLGLEFSPERRKRWYLLGKKIRHCLLWWWKRANTGSQHASDGIPLQICRNGLCDLCLYYTCSHFCLFVVILHYFSDLFEVVLYFFVVVLCFSVVVLYFFVVALYFFVFLCRSFLFICSSFVFLSLFYISL